VLLCGGLIERRSLRAELHIDGLAVGLVGPFEVRAVTSGGIAVAGALRLAALHHPLQDGSLEKVIQSLEFLLGLAEWLGRGQEGWESGGFAWRHNSVNLSPAVMIP
jgi:hypothetical protein